MRVFVKRLLAGSSGPLGDSRWSKFEDAKLPFVAAKG
jgi:hypothetical protein